MSDKPKKSSAFLDLCDTFTGYFLPPLTILTVAGTFKSLRNPWIRGSAFAFTAATQALWERDFLIQHRRALVKQAQNPQSRAQNWLLCHMFLSHLLPETVGASLLPLETELKKHGECGCVIFEEYADEIYAWDNNYGKPEIQHRIDTLYSSNAIFLKSLACGITLGTLPLFLKTSVLARIWWKKKFRSNEEAKLFASQFIMEDSADTSFNRWYAWVVGSKPFLDPSHWAIMNCMHMRAVESQKVDDDTMPERWYSRKGKLPIFQYDIEEEKS